MIKLIETDLDGTLLDGNRALPKAVFPLVKKLTAKGVLFAAASGRQYANLKKLFAPVADDVIFLCENGALIVYRGEILRRVAIPKARLREAIAQIRAIPHAFPLLCGTDCAYLDSDAEPFSALSFESYTNCKRVERLEDVVGREEICKIAVFDEIGAAENCIKILPALLPGLRTILSGADWCDVSAPEANKGAATRFLQRKFSIRREECAAFGDHMNDYEMLLECGNAFVPENAYPPLRRLIGRTVPSNEEGGVLKQIEEMLSGGEI